MAEARCVITKLPCSHIGHYSQGPRGNVDTVLCLRLRIRSRTWVRREIMHISQTGSNSDPLTELVMQELNPNGSVCNPFAGEWFSFVLSPISHEQQFSCRGSHANGVTHALNVAYRICKHD